MALPAHKSNEQGGSRAALRQSARWLRALLAHSYDALVLTDADGSTLFASPSIQRVLGYTPEEYLALNGADLTHPDHLEEGIAVFRSIREQPGVTLPPQHTRYRHKDGSWRWIEYTATNLLTDPNIAAIVFNFRNITERKQADEQLRYQATILANTEDAIISTGADYTIVSWNAAAERLYGWKAHEVLGKNALDVLAYEFLDSSPEEFRHTIAQEGVWKGEVTQRTRDGKTVTVLASVSSIRDAGGKVLALVAVNRDITERKRAEETQHLLAAIVSSSDDAIVSKTLEGIITSWNAAAERLFGYPPAEAVGRSITMIIPPDLYHEEVTILQKLRSGERIDHFETVRLRKDGTKVNVSLSISPVKDRRGKIIGAAKIARDITERKKQDIERAQLYRQAKEAREQLEIILQGVADGIVVYNGRDQIVYANEAAAHLTGFPSVQAMLEIPPDVIVAQFELIDEQGQPFPLAHLPHRRVLAGEQEAQAVVGYRSSATGQAEHWSLITTRPVLDEQGQVILAISILHDVTGRLRAEQRKDEFIGMASHELKTPVTSLKGFTTILQRRLSKQGDEQGQAYLAKMERQINRLTNLISELLDISRIQTGKLAFQEEVFDLSSLAQETVENIQQSAQTHRLSLQCTGPVYVMGDRERIGQVLVNLVTNAIKYSPQADRVIISVTSQADQALLSVQDFGIGIAREHQQHIFERFYQVAGPGGRTFPGLGIGLYLSNEIVSRHGGRIEVQSARGKGSTFSVILPLAREGKVPGASVEEPAKK